MIRQSPAKIYLADQRNMEETTAFRAFRLFTQYSSTDGAEQAFGDLLSFNDTMLAPGQSMQVKAERDARLLLLPLYGAIEWKQGDEESFLLAAGQLAVMSVKADSYYQLNNPFSDTVVNFLGIELAMQTISSATQAVAELDLNTFMNVLVQVAAGDSSAGETWRLSVGKFSGRGETLYTRRHPSNGLFFFVIEGAFEVEGRLLHSRDALALRDLPDAETEALSNDALLLVLELPISF
jgi:redox-sensitive bicupin YhaK (pirin superfamily)